MTTKQQNKIISDITKTAPIEHKIYDLEHSIECDIVAWNYLTSGATIHEVDYNIKQQQRKVEILKWVEEHLLSKCDIKDGVDFDLYKIIDRLFINLDSIDSDDD